MKFQTTIEINRIQYLCAKFSVNQRNSDLDKTNINHQIKNNDQIQAHQ